MKKSFLLTLVMLLVLPWMVMSVDRFPDGSQVSDWFRDKSPGKKSGKIYCVTNFGAVGDGVTLNTSKIQHVIDMAAAEGGGVVLIPEGVFLTGALFFKPGTQLVVEKKGVLKGSDDITHFPIMPSRMEGKNLDYFPAVVNAYGVDHFSISGGGIIDGNGLKYWKAFWQRRAENPDCTNLEVSRPRLIFIQHSNHVQIRDMRLQNSGFWTTHLYQCNYIKILNTRITSPYEPVKAPSTDAIDLDVCKNVLIDGCYLSVNDDAIALKGGKGPDANHNPLNGSNENIIIQNSQFGKCHGALTCGSESIHNRNIILRNITVEGADRVLWLKNRPDTPQLYEYITVENVYGQATRLLFAKPWRQFYNLEGKDKNLLSVSNHITFRNIYLKCNTLADIDITETDRLKNFTFENMMIHTNKGEINESLFDGIEVNRLRVKPAMKHP